MSQRVAITHTLEQRFERPVRLSTHWLRLRQAPHTRAPVTAYSLVLHAEPHYINWVRDPFENHIARVDLPEPLSALGIEVELIAELESINPLDFLLEPDAARHPWDYAAQLRKELTPYLQVSASGPRLEAWLHRLDRSPASTVERLTAVNRQVHEAHRFTGAMTPGPVDIETVLERGTGSSWELAWLLTLSLRHLGLAARFSCGYQVLLAQGANTRDSVTLHAWSETYLPGAGWIGLDPTMGVFTAEGHIPLACAPDPLRVVPVVGYREACDETRVEDIRVRRLVLAAPAWPYAEAGWADIQALGCHVAQDLAAQNLQPTVGVGLSLVSHDEGDAPEWNTSALGTSKRQAAEALLRRLWKRVAPGGVAQTGQGKWYAGDDLPRWRLSCFYRADGQPVWRNAARLGWGGRHEDPILGDARRVAQLLARALDIPGGAVLPAHEDTLHALWKTRAPLDYVPATEDLNDPRRRRVLAERLSLCRGEPAGYVLPLRWDHNHGRWASGRWTFRRGGLYLMPGDSPLGYRLPLDSLVDDEDGSNEARIERCQFEARKLLRERYGELSARLSSVSAPQAGIQPADEDGVTPHTALCVEVRGGQLYCFLPPLSHLEYYLDLVAAIEAVAEVVGVSIGLEGYDPPDDHRLQRIVLEPDTGVLRVTLPQLHGWEAQLTMLQVTYEEASQVGLRGERTMPDGRHLPTGGGSRLTLGGVRPVDSPFLRRPEILRTLIAYWQRHPSLSYFFAGQGVGPSSASPRPDEGREEALYELSIALERLPGGEVHAPWQADRILRHLLADPSGNLKRAEIRIDQLYAPERASLRLGRITIHSFETAPEDRLATLQSLLVLGLLGRFARCPDSAELVRWGPALHDRFMLPTVLWEDLRGVIEDLNAVGYPFQLEWFEPLLARRFPVLGKVQTGEITLELRAAHEPWPLLGEELTAGSVARFVDVANERLEVRLSGLAPDRYLLHCNGRRVPLQATGVHDEYVAGVRYKRADPQATLHPTIPPVEALVFDLIDSWTGRASAGCTYLPARPEVSGPVAAPLAAVSGGERSVHGLPPAPPVSLPPRSAGGRFLPEGSGLGPAPTAMQRCNDHASYLLDLTRLSE